jgi:lipopolysaccharide export system protein LptA
MKLTRAFLLWLAALALFGGAVQAETADRNKPMNVESDALRYDDLKQTSVFTGRVVLTKGSILIRGARVDVRQDADGYQFGLVTADPGKLAFYRQKREGLDEFIEGEGEVIEYDGRADTVKFIGKAQLRRYRSTKLNDEMTGAVILYNNITDVFSIDGTVAKARPGVPAGRVRAMLTPTPDATAKPANGASPVLPAPVLRATPALGGAQK